MKRSLLLIIASLLISHISLSPVAAQEVISLTGAWDFSVTDSARFDDYIMLPGSMLTNGKGNPVSAKTQWTGSLYDSSYYFNPYMEKYRQQGQMKFPFFLTPERHYVGKAWYHKRVYVPSEWKDRRITLYLERPHIETTVYVNGEPVGHQLSLSTPHRYDVTSQIKTGASNEILVRVYNGIENVCVGQDSHSVTDQTQGNWNGIVGRIELQAQWKKLYVKHVGFRADSTYIKKKKQWQKTAVVTVDLANHLNQVMPLWDYQVDVKLTPLQGKMKGTAVYHDLRLAKEAKNGRLEFVIPRENERLKGKGFDLEPWDEFHPNLYRLSVEVGDDLYEANVGLRDIRIEGRQFVLNGHPLFLRGTVENCCFPETGYPPMDEESWRDIFLKCKEWGLNHVRFHSYCPPEAAFAAADKVGIYLQPEGPSWPNHGVKLRRGQKIDEYLLQESRRIVDEYGHHPSFLMMAAGNEPAGDWVKYCNDWVALMHRYDSTRVYCGASVGGGWAWDDGSQYHVKGGARGLDWDRHAPSSDDDYFDQIERPRNFKPAAPPKSSSSEADSSLSSTAAANSSLFTLHSSLSSLTNHSPIIAHEQGQWCAFPDFKEMSQYTGVYQPRNFEIFQDLLRDGGMASMAEKFLMASGHLQTLCYKYEIERNLRTPDYAGFQLLALNDYSGQGTALVGPLNVHWREKGYVTDREWRQFCNFIVPLARFPKFVYTTADTLRVPVSAYNAFSTIVTGVRASYYVTTDSNQVIVGGTLPVDSLNIGRDNPLGTVVLPLQQVQAPCKLTLTVNFSRDFRNHWDFWVYPDTKTHPQPLPIGRGGDTSTAAANSCVPSVASDQRSSASLSSTAAANSSLFTLHSSLSTLHSTLSVTSDYREALAALERGETVLLEAAGKVTLGSDVVQHYLPVFWNTSWFKMRPPHTTGAYIDTSHPLFRYDFPTDSWSNLNWWELLNRAQVMNLCELPADYQSPIQPIDTWHVSRKLGMLIEARVGKGRLLMTTMDVSTNLDRRVVAWQMRQALLRYMQSPDFQPALTLEPAVVEHFFTRQAPAVNMFTNESPDELKPALK